MAFCKKVTGDAKELEYLLPEAKDYHSTWGSPEAFSRHIQGQNPKHAWHDSAWSKGSWFYGTKTMEEALKLSQDGWKAGAEQIEKVRARIQAEKPTTVRAVKYDIAGTTPNVPRAVAGNLFNMRAPDTTRSRRRPVITLLSSMAANCGVDYTHFANRAAVVAALIDEIETAGFACEVISFAPTKSSGFTASTSIIVKRCDQPVDVYKLAFALGHPGMFRRLVFADWGSEKTCEALGAGLGHQLRVNATEERKEKHIYVIPSLEDNSNVFSSEEKASSEGLKLIVDSLKEQGCPAFV